MAKSIITQVESVNATDLINKIADKVAEKLQPQRKQPRHKEQQTDRLMTRKEVAHLFGVSLVTIHHWTKKGLLKPYRMGTRIRFKESEVMQTLNKDNEPNKN